MINYTTLNHNLKRGILKFSEKISKNLSVPHQKFVTQMLFGVLSSKDSKLSSIGRCLNEKISLKKVIERLSRNLKTFGDGEFLFKNYLKTVKSVIGDKSLLIIDGGDITKPCATKMEDISVVRDGSTGEYKNGYYTLGITALSSERKLPIPVYTKVYTSEEKSFVSEKCEERITVMQLIESSKRIYKVNKFILYAVADGLFSVLSKYKQGISDFIKPSPKLNPLQLSLLDF